ncbi:MAG: hypothetical protein Q8Q07_01510 [Dehalococcoidales bacterium]|nr:hypothetical protein [Dehalococcoidales bacterium]
MNRYRKRFAALIILCLLITAGVFTGCSQGKAEQVTFDRLFSNLSRYNNREVTIEGFYFQGFEINVFSERLEYSGFAEGHLVPKGRMIWVSGGIPKDIYNKLDQQQMMGPTERHGKLRITGRFEYGGKYGHLDGYSYQIVPASAQLLPWEQ